MHCSAFRAGSRLSLPPRQELRLSFPVIDRLVREHLAQLAATPLKLGDQ
jgi:hypothetical protein